MRSLFLFIMVFAAFAGVSAAQEADAAAGTPVEIYLAKDDGTGTAGGETTEFSPTDIPIYCVVQLSSSDPVTVKMVLFAVSVPGVKPETKVVSSGFTTSDGQNRVNFTGRPSGRWVPGKYRVDVFVGETQAGSRSFTVIKPAPPATSPAAGRYRAQRN